MDIRTTQAGAQTNRGGSNERRLVDQFGRLGVPGLENGHVSGGSHKYENISNRRRSSTQHQEPFGHLPPPSRTAQVRTPQPRIPKIPTDEQANAGDLLKPNDLVKSRWRVMQKIGGGGFGEIYEAYDTMVDPEKLTSLSRGPSDLSDLCSYCAYQYGDSRHPPATSGPNQRNLSSLPMTQSDTAIRLRNCANCNNEFYSSGSNQRNSNEEGVDSNDSGHCSGHSNNSDPENMIVAIKTESNTQPKQMLRMEVAVLRRLVGKRNFCELLGCGKNARINYIVMTLQGKNLSELRKKSQNQSFSSSTALRIVCKCLDAVEDLHSIGFLHRDIKPSNFCLRKDNPGEVCLLDFGLVRQFTTTGSTSVLRPPRNSAGFRGTVRYASVNAHDNRELGRHDDLWSMYYMLVEFVGGSLPWRRSNDKKAVREKKHSQDHVALGVDAGLPESVAETWSNHLDSLNYYLQPKYSELRRVIENWVQAQGIGWEDPYDWQIPQMTRAESATTFTPTFKRNQQSGRQFVQNARRPMHHEQSGLLRRLDKRGFGSNLELKRMESDTGGGITAAQSTAALCDDAITNQNKTQVPGCITMATENHMLEGDEINADEGSEKVDGKERLLMGSTLDLAAASKPPPSPVDQGGDKQFLATSNAPTANQKQARDAAPMKTGRSNSNRRQKIFNYLYPRRTHSDTRKMDKPRK